MTKGVINIAILLYHLPGEAFRLYLKHIPSYRYENNGFPPWGKMGNFWVLPRHTPFVLAKNRCVIENV